MIQRAVEILQTAPAQKAAAEATVAAAVAGQHRLDADIAQSCLTLFALTEQAASRDLPGASPNSNANGSERSSALLEIGGLPSGAASVDSSTCPEMRKVRARSPTTRTKPAQAQTAKVYGVGRSGTSRSPSPRSRAAARRSRSPTSARQHRERIVKETQPVVKKSSTNKRPGAGTQRKASVYYEELAAASAAAATAAAAAAASSAAAEAAAVAAAMQQYERRAVDFTVFAQTHDQSLDHNKPRRPCSARRHQRDNKASGGAGKVWESYSALVPPFRSKQQRQPSATAPRAASATAGRFYRTGGGGSKRGQSPMRSGAWY